MKTRTRVLSSVAASLAVSALIGCMIYFVVRDMDKEARRGRVYDAIRSKTYALNLSIARLRGESDPNLTDQITEIAKSLNELFRNITYQEAREESLVGQIRTNSQELGYSLEKLISSHLGLGVGLETERYNVLVSQLWMKTQFILDDTRRLTAISESRIALFQHKGGILILVMIGALMLINGAISFFSGRSILRIQDGLERQRKWLKVTLASIGDAVIATDKASKIVFLNPIAASLTGWPIKEALGRPVQEVFRIINEKTREPAGDIVSHVMRGGSKVALANHTALVARDGREVPIEDSAAPIKDGTGHVTGAVLVFHDVTERRRAQEALEQIRADLSRAQEVGQIGSWRLDVRRSALTWSDENHRIFGVPKGTPMTYEAFLGIVHPDDRQHVDSQWKAGLAGERYDIEHRIVVGGQVKWVREKAYLEFDDAGELQGAFGITQDITERKRAEESLRRLSQFPEENPNPVLRCTADGLIMYTNAPARRWLETLGWGGDGPVPPSVGGAVGCTRGKEHAVVTEITNPAGRTMGIFAVQPPGEDYINLYGQDITDRKSVEDRMRASLAEKEVLLKEIHHRVKNNMQVISSLVALQAEGLQDGAMRDALQDVTHRVRSMAMVHEKLYQSPDLARVGFDEYARSLLNYLWRAHGTAASGIRLALDLEPISLSVDTAVPCGLILNEIASNALKHAFHGRAGGEVAVSLRGGMDGEVRLCVRDNGRGLPEGFDWKQATTLGLRLVQMLAGQLHAGVEVSSLEGTEFTITFERSKT